VVTQELLIRINGSAKGFQAALDKTRARTKALQDTLVKAAKISTVAFVGLATVVGLLVREFAKFETGLVGVAKTTDIAGDELDRFGDEIVSLSKTIPVTSSELLGIAQTAGQLGVEGSANLLKFTEVVARLGFATDLTGEEAATALTRIINITGESVDNIDRLASALVGLGNTSAATESEILRVATEVARSTSQFKLSSGEVLGLSTALKALGIQAQLGGSVVGRAFREIEASITAGGDRLDQLSKLTGIAGESLSRAFSEDRLAVFVKLVEGLGGSARGADTMSVALEKLGLRGDEINKVLPVLANRADILGQKLKTSNDEFERNEALLKESEAAFATLNSEFVLLRNSISAAALAIGRELAPDIVKLVKFFRELIGNISKLDKETLKNIATFIKYATIFTGITAVILTLGAVLIPLIGFLGTVGTLIGSSVVAVAGGVIALSAALTGLVAVASPVLTFFRNLFGLIEDGADLTDDELNVALEKTRKTLEEINKLTVTPFNERDIARQKKLAEEQIAALEKVAETRKRIAEAEARGVQTGPTIGPGGLPTLGRGIRALPPEQEPEVVAENKKQKLLAKLERDALARRNRIRKEEISLLRKQVRQASAVEITAVEQNLQTLQALEALKSKNLELLRKDDGNKKIQQQIEFNEQEIALLEEQRIQDELRNEKLVQQDTLRRDEINALKREQAATFSEQEIADLQAQILTKKDVDKKIASDNIKSDIVRRNKFIEDEKKFGGAVATVQKFFRSEEVQGVAQATSELVALQRSKNSTLKSIGKVAAIAQIILSTEAAAANAIEGFSRIPFIGVGLGFAAAAAIIAFGAERIANVGSAQGGGIIGGNQLGVVPGVGRGDRQLTLTEPGEIVVPRPLAPSFADQFAIGGGAGVGGERTQTFNFTFTGPVLSEEFFEGTIVPGVREAVINANGDIGIDEVA